jgi:hypothetical protein
VFVKFYYDLILILRSLRCAVIFGTEIGMTIFSIRIVYNQNPNWEMRIADLRIRWWEGGYIITLSIHQINL